MIVDVQSFHVFFMNVWIGWYRIWVCSWMCVYVFIAICCAWMAKKSRFINYTLSGLDFCFCRFDFILSIWWMKKRSKWLNFLLELAYHCSSCSLLAFSCRSVFNSHRISMRFIFGLSKQNFVHVRLFSAMATTLNSYFLFHSRSVCRCFALQHYTTVKIVSFTSKSYRRLKGSDKNRMNKQKL